MLTEMIIRNLKTSKTQTRTDDTGNGFDKRVESRRKRENE